MDLIVAVIGHRVLQQERLPSYLALLKENGFLILEQEQTLLHQGQAGQLRGQGVEDEDTVFTSGPVVILLMKRENAYAAFDQLREHLDFTYGSKNAWLALRDRQNYFPKEPVLERFVILLKPGYSQATYNMILDTLEQNNFVVLAKQGKMLTADQAQSIVGDDPAAVAYITSDLCLALIVERVGGLTAWHLMTGPSNPQDARRYAPNTLRARLGTDAIHNCMYSAPSVLQANRDIDLLFSDPLLVQRSFALVRRDASGHMTAFERALEQNHFQVLTRDQVYLSKQRAEQFFVESRFKCADRAGFIASITNTPVDVLVVAKSAAVAALQTIARPFLYKHASVFVYTSKDAATAAADIHEFFPQLESPTVPHSSVVSDFLQQKPDSADMRSLQEVLVEGLTQLCREKPMGSEAVTWLAHWLIRNNPNKPKLNAPADVKPTVALVDEVTAAHDDAEVQIVWVVGGPATGKNVFCSKLAAELGFYHINVLKLLKAAEVNSTEYGSTIGEYLSSKRPVPTHIVLQLIQTAIVDSGSVRFLISHFPSSLDHALAFEKKIGKPDCLLRLVGRSTAPSRLTGKELVERTRTFDEEMQPLFAQYKLFHKLRTVQAGEDALEAGRKLLQALI